MLSPSIRKRFEQQMQQDPNSWTEEQKREYDNFVEWETKND